MNPIKAQIRRVFTDAFMDITRLEHEGFATPYFPAPILFFHSQDTGTNENQLVGQKTSAGVRAPGLAYEQTPILYPKNGSGDSEGFHGRNRLVFVLKCPVGINAANHKI